MYRPEQLKSMPRVVADTGDLDAIIQYRPQDAVTTEQLAEFIRLFTRGRERLQSRPIA